MLRLATLGLLCLLSGRAFAAETILLLPLELSGGLDGSRADLEAAVAKGLAVAGRPVVRPDDVSSGTYVVSGSIAREGSTFSASFLLVRSSDKVVVNSQANNCDVADCSVGELARRSARELVRQTLGRPLDAKAPPVVVSPIVTPAPNAEVPSSRPTTLAAMSLAAGAVAVGAGVYMIAVDDHCSSTVKGRTCKRLNTTLAGGIAAVAGGVAAGALGVYLLVRDDSKSGGPSLAIGVQPSGLSLAGRF
jgi:hypothetical protein